MTTNHNQVDNSASKTIINESGTALTDAAYSESVEWTEEEEEAFLLVPNQHIVKGNTDDIL